MLFILHKYNLCCLICIYFVALYTYIHVGGHTLHAYMCESLTLMSGAFFNASLPYLLTQGLLLNLKLVVLYGWADWLGSFENALGYTSLMQRLQEIP